MSKLFAKKIDSFPWLTLSAGVLVLVVWLLPNACEGLLAYNRIEISNGAFWQLLTGHFVHWNLEHLWVDLAVFGVIGSMVERRSKWLWIGLLFSSMLSISLSVFYWRPSIETYRGLSGVDMAFAGFWILDSLIHSIRAGTIGEIILWGCALLGVLLKPMIEIALGHPIFVQDLGQNVIGLPLSHIVGVLVGCGVLLFHSVRLYPICCRRRCV